MEHEKNTAASTPDMMTISRAEYEERKLQSQWRLEQLGLVKKRQFGTSSEWLQEDVYCTYACKQCEAETGEGNLRKAPRQPALCPGSFASPEAVAHIIMQKFVMHSPLYRLEQEFQRQGLKLPLPALAPAQRTGPEPDG